MTRNRLAAALIGLALVGGGCGASHAPATSSGSPTTDTWAEGFAAATRRHEAEYAQEEHRIQQRVEREDHQREHEDDTR